jgi:DNA polymerase III alpha subunit
MLDEIESVEFYSIEETYDLEVDHEDHTFYANEISVSNSHAISYSIATFQCAYLLTYYPDEWVTACLDYAALEKGKVVGQEDPKAVAIREAQKLGYKFSKPDINFSSAGYEIHPTKEKTIIPGLTTIEGIGDAALEEINKNKPYKSIKDLLVNEDGTWKHSKFNRKALTNLICLEALDSLNIISPDGELQNYKQLYNVIIENFDLLKKISTRKKNNDITPVLEELIKKEKELNTQDWTKAEKTKFWLELAGGADLSLILDKKYLTAIEKMNLVSVDNIKDIDFLEEGENKKITEEVWFILRKITVKTTKTGKLYAELSVIGEKFSDLIIKVWGLTSKEILDEYPIYEVYCGTITKDKYGLSTNLQKIASLTEIYDYLFSDS